MRIESRRTGFALPMAILLIGFMTAGLVAAFTRIEAESRTVDNFGTETAAFAVAQEALDRVLASGGVKYPFSAGTSDSGSIVLPGGDSAVVVIKKLRDNPASKKDTTIWLIRSTGRTRAHSNGRPGAARTVAQLAYRIPVTLQAPASWTSLSGLDKQGASGAITGVDGCGEEVPKPGVALPTGTFGGKDDAIAGDPPILEMGTLAQAIDQVKVDWNSVISDPPSGATVLCEPGTYGFLQDSMYSIGSGWNSRCDASSWPSSFPSSTDYDADWPVVIVNGSSALPSNGTGLLIVTGDLTFGGGDTWSGIILVGGRIVDNGSGNIEGAVISGLNVMSPNPTLSSGVGQSSKANGTKDYTYDSCKIAQASSGVNRLTVVSNAWLDNWPQW